MRQRNSGFTLVEIMIVVAILAILIAIAVPSFLRAREIARRNACQENLSKIDGAKQQWALENSATVTLTPDWTDLVGLTNYIRRSPQCPGSGTYAVNDMLTDPTCTLSSQTPPFEHVLDMTTGGT